MNLTTSKRDLLRLASRMSAVAQRKGTMPSLACTRLTATKGTLRCEATDLNVTIDGTVPAEVSKPGSFAVSAHELVARVKMMQDGPITIECKGDALTIKCKGSARRYTMRGMPGDDFPPVPRPEEGAAHIPLDASTLTRLIAHTAFSVSTDETRANLNSALLEIENGIARMVSTDGHRLSKAECPIEGHASLSMLIPLKAVTEIRRLAEDAIASEDSALRLTQSGPYAFFSAGDVTFTSKLVDAVFPPYAQVIPKSSARTFRVSRSALLDAVRAVAVSAGDNLGVRLSFNKGDLRVTSEDPTKGEGVDEVSYDLVDGKDGALVGMNSKYLGEVLTALSSDDVELGVSAELDPVVVRPVGETGGLDFVGVLMPLRL